MVLTGEAFCGSKCDLLRGAVEGECRRYVEAHHTRCLGELRAVMESEGWAVCPLHSDFKLEHLVEFRFLKLRHPANSLSPSKSNQSLEDPWRLCPFEQREEAPEDLEVSHSEEEADDWAERRGDAPIVINSTLTVMRLLGKYTRMTCFLHSATTEVLLRSRALVHVFLLAVYK